MSRWSESGVLDRCEHLRRDDDWVADQWSSTTALLLAVDDAGQVSVEHGEVLALPLAVGFPALWALAPSRTAAAAVAAGYFLAASRGLPQGVMNFYGGGFEAGIALWLALPFVSSSFMQCSGRPDPAGDGRCGTASPPCW